MKFTYKKKSVDVIFNDGKIFFNKKNLLNHKLYFVPASLTTEYAYVAIVLNVPLLQKKYGKCIFLRSDSWLKHQTDLENDSEIVDMKNALITNYFKIESLTDKVEAIPGSKMEKEDVYLIDNQSLCPVLNFYFNFKALAFLTIIFTKNY